jgi:polar amino acid transport system substrate-binding protein
VETNPGFCGYYERLVQKYATLPVFAESVRQTTRDVLSNSGRSLSDAEAATDNATHYLLSELAFMEFAPEFFASKRVCYLYHHNWPVYEDYISGRYDGVAKPHLDFLLLEAPYETYEKKHEAEIDRGGMLHDTYSRVMQSGILRAAYVEYPPVIRRDGAGFTGIFFEIIARFAKTHNLNIEWVEETGYGVVIDGLAEGRFDIFASAIWPTPERHTKAGLSRPLYYSDVGVWVRTDSPLARADWIDLNDPQHSIALTEGDITHEICLTDFTFAKWIRAPQLGRVKALLDFVADGRADATLVERMTYEAYAPGLSHRLINIADNKPIRRYPNCFLVGKDQNDFLDVINGYIQGLHRNGEVEEIVSKYMEDPRNKGIYFRH